MANHWLSRQQKGIYLGIKAHTKIKILLKGMEINALAIKFKQITFDPAVTFALLFLP